MELNKREQEGKKLLLVVYFTCKRSAKWAYFAPSQKQTTFHPPPPSIPHFNLKSNAFVNNRHEK